MAGIKVRENLYWVGIQDHDLRVFDVVMYTDFGTSYNSYILKTSKGYVLFETVKEKFFDRFLENIKSVCDPKEIVYIVVDHTEPDHAGSLKKLLPHTPDARVLGSPIALDFLEKICNQKIPGTGMNDDQELDMGDCRLRFLSVPFLHWPDSYYTYIDGMDILVTCDSFGCHYADDRVCNDLIEGDFVEAYRYYFNMIMGPFKGHVRYALDRIKDLKIGTICPGHGPVLRKNLDYYLDLYREWSAETDSKTTARPRVVIPYVSAYGYTGEIADEIIKGIKDTVDADIILFDMVDADPKEVFSLIESSEGVLFGTPTINGDALPPVLDLVNRMNGIVHGGKVVGTFGSYGWSGEGPDILLRRLELLRMETLSQSLKVNFRAGVEDMKRAFEYGKKFAKKLSLKTDGDKDGSGKGHWKCTVCGEIFESAMAPTYCPACGAGAEAFIPYNPDDVSFRNDQEMKVVIIGSGVAATSTAESIRKRNSKANIDLYSREKVLPYYRPMLSKALHEDIPEQDFFIHSGDFYEENEIGFHPGREIIKIDPTNKKIETGNNELIAYDKLVIATGARCFVPPIEGAGQLKGVFTLREYQCLQNIKKEINERPRHIVVIGGGLLGLEIADALALQGDHEVTVCEVADTILPMQLDEEGAKVLTHTINKSKVQCKLGVMVEKICGEEHVEAVRIRDGESIPCDLVIVSAGVRSNINLAEDAGIKIDRAISVGETMQTTDPDIYAVGDCAMVNGRFFGIWEPALEQGKIAGANICGESKNYDPSLNGATLNAFGTKVFSIGDIGRKKQHQYRPISTVNEMAGIYKKLYFEKGHLVGGILIGDLSSMNLLYKGVIDSITYEDAKELRLF